MQTQPTQANGDAELLTPGAFMTNAEAMRKFGISNSILYALAKRGIIHHTPGQGFIEAEIVAALKANKRMKRKGRAPAAQAKKPGRKAAPPPDPNAPTGNTITASAAAKKYRIHPSTIFYWLKAGHVRRMADGKFSEADIAKRATSPEFKRNRASAKVRESERKSAPRAATKKPPRARAASPEADLSHHVAYVAGHTDAFLDHYARSNSIDPVALRAGLAKVLEAR